MNNQSPISEDEDKLNTLYGIVRRLQEDMDIAWIYEDLSRYHKLDAERSEYLRQIQELEMKIWNL